jgi:hypothetical protein
MTASRVQAQINTPTAGKVIMVTNLNDSGPGSLRQTIAEAKTGDVIAFAPQVYGTINIGTALIIDKDLTIKGPGPKADAITLRGADIMMGRTETMVILNNAKVNLELLHFTHSLATALFVQRASVSINNSMFSKCRGTIGGAIGVEHGGLEVRNSTFFDNSSANGGAIAVQWSVGPVRIFASTFFSNGAGAGGGDAVSNFLSSEPMQLINVTIHSGAGRGITSRVVEAATASIEFRNTLLFSDVEPDMVGFTSCNANDKLVFQGVNMQGGRTRCQPLTGVSNLQFGKLQDNGGPTLTLAQIPGSDGIGAGNLEDCRIAFLDGRDQRGFRLPTDAASCDLGAVQSRAR